jgi:spore protease
MPELYSELKLSNVSVLIPRVLGQTGIESADIIKAAIDKTSPDAVVVIDALASRSMTRLCKTVQITDTGITPGSGVGNDRDELSSNTLGLPVIAIGIPTVVDSVTLTSEVIRSASEKIEEGIEDDEVYGDFVSRLSEIIESDGVGMVVTPKDIDRSVVKCSRLLSLAINKALHFGLTQEEINALLDI